MWSPSLTRTSTPPGHVPLAWAAGHLDRGRDGLARAHERVEEGVSLGVDLLPLVRGEDLAHEAPMDREQLSVGGVPSCLSSAVLPAMSLNTKVTVPEGSATPIGPIVPVEPRIR